MVKVPAAFAGARRPSRRDAGLHHGLLAEAGFDPAQADALTAALRDTRPTGGEYVTPADLDARISAQDDRIDARISALEARIYRAMLLQAGAIVGAVVAILRFAG